MNWIIDTDLIMVRPIEVEDAKYFHKWWNDGNLMKDVGFKDGLKLSLEEITNRFQKRISADSDNKLFIVYDKQLNVPIGELSYGEINLEERSCRIGMKICELEYQGRGYGKHSLCEFLKYLFTELDLEIIYIDTLMTNTRAINLYQKIGSKVMEIKKAFWTNPEGVACDAIFFQLTREDFFNYYQ